MNFNLVVIFCRSVEDSTSRLFLPYWQRSGCDLLFSSPQDQPSKLENVMHFNAGKAITFNPNEMYFLQERTLATMKHCLTLNYSAFLFTQYDSFCTKPLPIFSDNDCAHNCCGGPQPGFTCPFILHPPWIFGRNKLKSFVDAADLHPIQSERGFMDMWLGWILDLHKIEFTCIDWGWTCNSMDTAELVAGARAALAGGKIIFFHGIKGHHQLSQLLA